MTFVTKVKCCMEIAFLKPTPEINSNYTSPS